MDLRAGRFRRVSSDADLRTTVTTGVPNAELVSMTLHMHDRGKDATQRLTYPDGRSEIILQVPKYDFNWQQAYLLAAPLRIPKGTRARLDAHFNNTVRRGYLNPNLTVYWGDQTWEEMMSNWLGVVVDTNVDPQKIIRPLNGSIIGGVSGDDQG